MLGALKSKRIDIVVGKRGIGPVLAISVKGTCKAFRNLVNRTEEAVGDCANIHIMYPGLVYGFVHFLRATDETDGELRPNDILLRREQVLASVKDYARILEGLAGRNLVRNDYSRYEATALALLKPKVATSDSVLYDGFPESTSVLRLDKFFATLYGVYDLRYVYTYTDPGLKHLARVMWHPDSPALLALASRHPDVGFSEYTVRIAGA